MGIIDDVIEAPCDYGKLFKLMVNYKMKILRIQRQAKKFLAVKRARKQVLYYILVNYVNRTRINENLVQMVYKAFMRKVSKEGTLNIFSDRSLIENTIRSIKRKK